MAHVHFAKRFTVEMASGLKVYPAGWRGEAPDDDAEKAQAAGVLRKIVGRPLPANEKIKTKTLLVNDPEGPKAEGPKAKAPKVPKGLDAMKRSKVDEVAADLEIDPAEYGTKAKLISAINDAK
jgi:hypothetical protein